MRRQWREREGEGGRKGSKRWEGGGVLTFKVGTGNPSGVPSAIGMLNFSHHLFLSFSIHLSLSKPLTGHTSAHTSVFIENMGKWVRGQVKEGRLLTVMGGLFPVAFMTPPRKMGM